MKLSLGRVTGSAVVALCLVGSGLAQEARNLQAITGDWVYRLGPKPLFGLHLEPEPTKVGHLRGYVLTPDDFNLNLLNGTLLVFSHISSKSQEQPISSLLWKGGALQLKDPSPAHVENAPTYLVKPVDATDVDVTLFSGCQS